MKYTSDLSQLAESIAETIAERGVAAVDPSLIDTMSAHATRVGASPILVGIFADAVAPAPARARAFGQVLAQISRHAAHEFTVAA